MSDNLKDRGPQDRARVNVHEDWEVRYWCEKFGCNKLQLVAAVSVVGVIAKDVEAYLKKK